MGKHASGAAGPNRCIPNQQRRRVRNRPTLFERGARHARLLKFAQLLFPFVLFFLGWLAVLQCVRWLLLFYRLWTGLLLLFRLRRLRFLRRSGCAELVLLGSAGLGLFGGRAIDPAVDPHL